MGRGAYIAFLVIYIACCAICGPDLLSAPHASCTSSPIPTSGNMTLVGKPVCPVVIGEGQISVGATWTYIYNLKADHTYHIYLLGDWADPVEHSTDYDIFVYEVSGTTVKLVSSHTESAGLPEQVGNDGYGRYFTPSRTGTYYLCVENDPSESSSAEAGTLMAIEQIDLNRWYGLRMHGKVSEEPVRETTWAYEFNTSAERIRVFVRVPDSLDMYEARLYVMANPEAGKGELFNGGPVAWEPGLRGERSGFYGGFNLDSQGFRHVDAMASCEHSGEDMVIDYEAPAEGGLLYHLGLIAEYFSGTVEFIVQTDFDPPAFQLIEPPTTVEAGEPTPLRVSISDETGVTSVSLSYSTDGGDSWERLAVSEEGGGVYRGRVPSLDGGTVVDYAFEAEDEMGNAGEVRGSFRAVSDSSLTLRLDEDEVTGGEGVTASGQLSHGGKEVEIVYEHGDEASNFTVTTDASGSFSHAFTPTAKGEWKVHASFPGDDACQPALSETLNFTVSPLPTSLTCALSEERIKPGKEVTISGEFSLGMAGVEVGLTLAVSDNVTTLSATTSSDGGYSVGFTPESEGVWSIRAEVEGDGFRYEGAESPAVELAVAKHTGLVARVLGLPSLLIRPPYLYGVLAVIAGAAGGVFFYLRRRE